MDASVPGIMSLAEWRREMFGLYAAIRTDPDSGHAWKRWCDTRHALFREHPQSPLAQADRASYAGPHVFAYEPAARAVASLEALDGGPVEVGTSDGLTTRMLRFARARFELFAQPCTLDVFWLDQYGGGIYLAFRDGTSGTSTYGGGRYLVDTVKGADLGVDGDRLVLDFNFAYQPSCSYDPRWSCPLPPPVNRLDLDVVAGERSSEPAG